MCSLPVVPALQHVSVQGSAAERGKQIGRLTREKILHSLDTYERLFAVCDIPWHQAVAKARKYTDSIQRLSPSLLDELTGIASGSGVDFDALLALNCRTEILPSNFLSKVMAEAECVIPKHSIASDLNAVNECTSFAVAGSQKNYWLAQNWDWCGLQREALCVVESHCEPQLSHITVTEAGMLAKIGLNSHGFAITLNILRSDKDGLNDGVPVHFLLRALLDCTSVEHAQDVVSSLSFSSSSNVMVQDASGVIANFELSPYGVKVLKPSNDSFCHTNHFINHELEAYDVGRPGNQSTINRLNRAVSAVHAEMSHDDIVELLCDQSDGLESICRFADKNLPDIAQIETVAAVIMNPVKKTLSVSGAQPSISKFKTYSLH